MIAVSGAVLSSADSMLSVTRAPVEHPESPTLVVATTVLQLSLVVVVWLLALVPAAIAALTVLAFQKVTGKTVRGALRRTSKVLPPPEDQR